MGALLSRRSYRDDLPISAVIRPKRSDSHSKVRCHEQATGSQDGPYGSRRSLAFSLRPYPRTGCRRVINGERIALHRIGFPAILSRYVASLEADDHTCSFFLSRRSSMCKERVGLNRRRFLKTAVQAGACLAVAQVIPGTALGKNGSVAPSERILLGAHRDRQSRPVCARVLPAASLICGSWPSATCGATTGKRAKDMVDAKNGDKDCTAYIDMRELLARDDIDAVLIATGPNWHATAATMAAKAGKDVYCEKPCTKNIAQSLALADIFRRTGRVFQAGTQRRSLPNFAYAVELGPDRQARQAPDPPRSPRRLGDRDQRLAAGRAGTAQERWIGTCTSGRPPGGPTTASCSTPSTSKKAAAWSAAGASNGAPTALTCASGPTMPTTPRPWSTSRSTVSCTPATPTASNSSCATTDGCRWARARSGSKAKPAGSRRATMPSSPPVPNRCSLRRGTKIPGYPADFHVRNFLDCVKTRALTRANADAACWAHIACHAANIALFLDRKVRYDPKKNEFIGDEQANRLRSEALREPWRI